MKPLLLSILIMFSASVFAQVRQDTIFGVALVLDTLEVWQTEKLTTSVWPAYSITSYLMVKKNNSMFPKVTNVQYFRLDNCNEIQTKRLFYFKQQ